MKSTETICVAWVHGGSVDTEFAMSLIELVRKRSRVTSYHCVYGTGLLAKSRNILVSHFLDNTEDDWLLMLDSDERMSLDAFDKLTKAANAQERPIVAGLYFAALWQEAGLRPVPLIFDVNEDGKIAPLDAYPKDEIIRIKAAGTGCLLMHRSALKKIRDNANALQGDMWCWFQDGPIGGGKWLSEDLSFCARLQQLDIPMYAHTGAILDHHKDIWINEAMYDKWLAVNEPGAGLDQLQ